MSKISDILKTLEKRANEQSLPIIGPVKGQTLVNILKRNKPKRVLEIGTLIGYSSMLMSSYLPKGGHITTIEINPKMAKEAKATIQNAALSGKIDILIGDAINIIPKLKDLYQMIFLDGAKDEYLDYLILAENKLSKKGVVVADNVKIFQYTLSGYLDYVKTSGKYISKTIDYGFDALEVSKLVA